MPTGFEISREYIQEVILPGLRIEIGDEIDRLAVAVIGAGSDAQGWDDEIITGDRARQSFSGGKTKIQSNHRALTCAPFSLTTLEFLK